MEIPSSSPSSPAVAQRLGPLPPAAGADAAPASLPGGCRGQDSRQRAGELHAGRKIRAGRITGNYQLLRRGWDAFYGDYGWVAGVGWVCVRVPACPYMYVLGEFPEIINNFVAAGMHFIGITDQW